MLKLSGVKKMLLLVMILAIIVDVSFDITKVANPEWYKIIFNMVFCGSMIFIVFIPLKTLKDLIFVLITGYATIIMPLVKIIIKNDALNIKITIYSFVCILLYFTLYLVHKDISRLMKNKNR